MPDASGFPINTIGLNLFFSATATSYNAAYQAGVGIPGHLTVFTSVGTGSFATPAAGTVVQSYNTSGFSVNAALYSGATAFQVGGDTISVTAFSATSAPSGSVTLTVVPTASVPEPASFALLGSGLLSLLSGRRQKLT